MKDYQFRVVNLTRHEVKLVGREPGSVVTLTPYTEPEPRVQVETKQWGATINGVLVVSKWHSGVVGLPEPEDGVLYLVSRMVAEALRYERSDLLYPGDLEGGVMKTLGTAYVGALGAWPYYGHNQKNREGKA